VNEQPYWVFKNWPPMATLVNGVSLDPGSTRQEVSPLDEETLSRGTVLDVDRENGQPYGGESA